MPMMILGVIVLAGIALVFYMNANKKKLVRRRKKDESFYLGESFEDIKKRAQDVEYKEDK